MLLCPLAVLSGYTMVALIGYAVLAAVLYRLNLKRTGTEKSVPLGRAFKVMTISLPTTFADFTLSA